MNKQVFLRISLMFFSVMLSMMSYAQCAMCKATAEKSEYANGINLGVEYLLAAPILLVGAVALIWLRNKDKFMARELK